IGDMTPERMAFGFTGRFFVVVTAAGLVQRPRVEPGTLFRFTHRLGCLQKTQMPRVLQNNRRPSDTPAGLSDEPLEDVSCPPHFTSTRMLTRSAQNASPSGTKKSRPSIFFWHCCQNSHGLPFRLAASAFHARLQLPY